MQPSLHFLLLFPLMLICAIYGRSDRAHIIGSRMLGKSYTELSDAGLLHNSDSDHAVLTSAVRILFDVDGKLDEEISTGESAPTEEPESAAVHEAINCDDIGSLSAITAINSARCDDDGGDNGVNDDGDHAIVGIKATDIQQESQETRSDQGGAASGDEGGGQGRVAIDEDSHDSPWSSADPAAGVGSTTGLHWRKTMQSLHTLEQRLSALTHSRGKSGGQKVLHHTVTAHPK